MTMESIFRRSFLKALMAPAAATVMFRAQQQDRSLDLRPGKTIRYSPGLPGGTPDNEHIVLIAIEELETGEWVEFDRQRVRFVIDGGVLRSVGRAVFGPATKMTRLVECRVYSVNGYVANGTVSFNDNRPEPVLPTGEFLGMELALTEDAIFPEVLAHAIPEMDPRL